ncbi:MAG TPA: dihydrolipoamide acetyltransferase family protein [Roseiflexaceae bacterium]|nr:dihydrolipoamide acetyltransferase family protein [Roseiflexaceae bacterium]
MAVELLMPRLGWTMEEGVFLQWLKQDGEQVRPGDLLYTIEGDKASNDVEAFDSGILRIPPDAPPPGTTLPVGALLGYIVQPGERAPFEGTGDKRQGTSDRGQGTGAELGTATTRNPQPTTHKPQPPRREPAISPRARRVASELGVDWSSIVGSGRTGRIVERDVHAWAAAAAPASQVRASPLARRVAQDLGVDLAQLASAQPGRRLDRSAVEQAARALPAAAPIAPIGDQGLAMSGVRRITAARMAESAHTAAPVTLTTDADATELVRLRSLIGGDLAGADIRAPSYTDLLIKLVALALLEHPALNATLAGDRIIQHSAAHIGIAVDSERGLLVPVVRDAQSKSVQQIASDSARLIELARAGRATPDDLSGGTFTLSNLGMYEIDAFTPIINLPECAILGLGRIVARPVVIDEASETIAVRKMIALSLTFDHRVVDGAPAARFLKRVKQFVEHPYVWLTR